MQYSWTYAGNDSVQYNIGLYHGEETGHVMIYCNDSIVLIDFQVLEQKKYSFYLGDEFFELFLNRELDQDFTYELKINDQVNTPLNNSRNKNQHNYNRISLILGIVFLLMIIIMVYLSIRKTI